MTKIFVAQHPTEAHLVVGLLASRGIPAEVRGESLFSTRGETPVTPTTLPSVWVLDDAEVGRALEILRESSDADDADPPWTCEGCGEQVEAGFTECWNCGRVRGL